jgi:purine-binding chemotaxis protein CheW
MNKTPEEYFQEQEFAAEALETHEEFTSAEKAFIEKYLGLAEDDLLTKLGIDAPVDVKTVSLPQEQVAPAPEEVAPSEAPIPEGERERAEEIALAEETVAPQEAEVHAVEIEAAAPEARDDAAQETRTELAVKTETAPTLDQLLRDEPEVQLVSFFLDQQEYTLPIKAVQEVIRYVAPTKLPGAGSIFAGVINLRGKVTPLFKLRQLVGMKSRGESEDERDKFIIVCRYKGLQIGLLVRNVATIYRTPQKQIEWGIESRLGGDIELVTGLMKTGDYLVGIFSIDRIIDKVLRT